MKIVRYTLFGILGIVALALIAAAVFILTFDPKQYKGDIERLVLDQTGRTLVLSDDIEMSLYPNLGVRIGPTRLTEQDGKTTFISVEAAQVSVALMPLIQRQILVDGVTLSGLVANIVKDKSGRFNFDDLTGDPASVETVDPVEVTGTQGDSTEITFDVGSVTLQNGSVSYLDQASGEQINLRELNLSTGQLALRASGEMKFSGQVQAPALPIDARINLTGRYALDIPEQRLSLDGAVLGIDGYAMQIQNLAATLKTSLHANFADTRFDLKGIEIDAASRNLFKASIRSAGLILNQKQLTIQQLDASANVDQPGQKLGLQFQTPELTGTTDRFVMNKFTSSLMADIPGTLRQPVKVPLQGNLSVDLAKQTMQSTFSATVDESKINATVNLPRFAPLAVRADVKIDQIDLDRYLDQGDAANPSNDAAKGSTGSSAGSGAPARIDLSALNSIDVRGKIDIARVKVRGLQFANLKTDINASKGQLRVGPHSAQLSDGSIQGDFSINANNNQIQIKETISKIAIGQLLKELGQESRLEGQANLGLDLTTRGDNTDQFKQNLGGLVSFNVADGAIRGVDIARLLRNIQGIITTGKLPEFSENDRTVFSELSGTVNIKQGVATNKDLSMKAPIFRVQGQGEVNLVTSQVNYLARLSVVETTQGQGGPELEALRGVTIPVRLTGPFDNIGYQLDIASIAAEIAKSRAGQTITNKIEEAIGPERTQQIEKLLGPDISNKLKGLFGQ